MSSKSIIKRTWVVGTLTMISRMLGLVRDKALVLVFAGTGGVLDAFLLAFTIPNLFRRLFGEGALSGAFMPVYINYRENVSKEESDSFASSVLAALFLFLAAVAGVGALFCLGGAAIQSENIHGALALKLTAFMLPFMVFVCVAALMSGMLQSVRVFSLPAFMPVLLNICMLGGLSWIYWRTPDAERSESVYYLAAAVVLAALLQVLWQFAALRAKGVRVGFRAGFSHPGIKKVLAAMGPSVLGLAVFQINVLLDRLIAYVLIKGDGPLTHLYLGNRLMQLPLALFGISLVTTLFPEIVSHMKRGENKELFNRMATGIRFLMFLLLPAMAGLIAVSEPVIRALFQEPDLRFGDTDVYNTSMVLALYAPGLFFISFQQLLTRVFYARDDYITPVKISVKMVVLNLILNLVLIHAPDLYMRYAYGVSARLGEGGLALSTSITAAITAFLMWLQLRKVLRTKKVSKDWDEEFSEITPAIWRIGGTAIGTGVFAWLVARSLPTEPEMFARLQRGVVPVVAGVLFYIILCYCVPVQEITEFNFLSRKKKDG